MQVKAEKTLLRARYKKLRAAVDGKAEKSAAACEKLLESSVYKAAEQVLCYYPVKDETDTLAIIKAAFQDKKKVALPVCRDRGGNMDFYYIESFGDVRAGAFGIPEPDTGVCRKLCDNSHSIIIVPALSFDVGGFRLGYGGGYYDKFLKKFINSASCSVGLCYNELVCRALAREAHDIAVEYICTEKSFFKTKRFD